MVLAPLCQEEHDAKVHDFSLLILGFNWGSIYVLLMLSVLDSFCTRLQSHITFTIHHIFPFLFVLTTKTNFCHLPKLLFNEW